METKGVPYARDHRHVVASLVLKETVSLSVPGASRLLGGLILVMLNAVEDASASVGAHSTGRLNRIARIKLPILTRIATRSRKTIQVPRGRTRCPACRASR